MYPVFLYKSIVSSFSYARLENQESEVEKVNERETWSAELSTSGSRQMGPVRHGHRIGIDMGRGALRGWIKMGCRE